MEFLFILIALVILAAVALRWGADSRFDASDPDLEQREGWQIV